MDDLKGKSISGITDVDKEQIELILEVSRDLKKELKQGKAHRLLEGKSLGGIFETPSTRTSISFETAMMQLGGHMLWLDQHRLWVGEAAEEDWHDTIKTLSRYLDGIAYRALRRERVDSAVEVADIPVINASCPVEHPCQAFADVLTMQEKKGNVRNHKVAFCWGYRTANPPAGLVNSTMLMAGKLGFTLSIACPEGFDPDPKIQAMAEEVAAMSGGSIEIVRSYEEAVVDADFINVYSWVSPEVFARGLETHFQGDPEFIEMKATLKDQWIVDRKIVDMAKQDAYVMHCMPISRNTEVTDEVLSSDKSIIFDEAENRLHTEKAMLALTMGGYR
ncbi:MAG: ornithine carbamoyltransferase [Candidatus Bipolaricaulota bacterium]|nr:MAG: ornithine carbamoyltransferase [Candidatus Bipolaricaulota bacterium]